MQQRPPVDRKGSAHAAHPDLDEARRRVGLERDALTAPAVHEPQVRVRCEVRTATAACTALALINCALVGTTWLFSWLYRRPDFDWTAHAWTSLVLVQLSLATEDVAATWYASMLLLLVGVVACLCFAHDWRHAAAPRDRLRTFGWIILACGFAVLSFDEMGSLHERLNATAALGDSAGHAIGWVRVLLIPMAVVALGFAVFGWMYLRSERQLLALIVLGVVALVCVPVLEDVKNAAMLAAQQTSDWRIHEVYVAAQEGTELFASLAFLAAFALYLAKKSTAQGHEIMMSWRASAKAGAVIVAALANVAWLASVLPGESELTGRLGTAENWPASVAALLAALFCIQLYVESPPTKPGARRVYAITALFGIGLSAYVGSSLYLDSYWHYMPRLEAAVHLPLALGAIVLGTALSRRAHSIGAKLAAVAFAIATPVALLGPPLMAPYLIFCSFGLLLVSLPLHARARAATESPAAYSI